MLTLNVVMSENFDENTGRFGKDESFTLELEHSLVSLSKWESKFEKPFIGSKKTNEETLWYIEEALTLTPNVPPEVFHKLSNDNLSEINSYISAKMSATTFHEQPGPEHQEIITAELIYYWMFSLSIPKECEHWHLNRLLTLVRVFNVKNSPAKKMTPGQIAEQQRRLNAERRAQFNTKG
jgi:hypothetical protein